VAAVSGLCDTGKAETNLLRDSGCGMRRMDVVGCSHIAHESCQAGMAELADAADSKSSKTALFSHHSNHSK
jgi:hypothetical protein